jgi:hypothetical protein
MPNDFFQPKGDPYRYKVKGDTVQFVATQDTAGHRKGETGEVSKSQIINDNPEWARRHLNVDTSPKAASEPGGTSRPRPDSPKPTTTPQPETAPSDSTQAASGGESVFDMIRKASGAAAPNAVQRNAEAQQKENTSGNADGVFDFGFGKGTALSTRGILGAAASTVGAVTDPIVEGVNAAAGTDIGRFNESVQSVLSAAGVPEAQNQTERMAQIGSGIAAEAMAGGAGVARSGVKLGSASDDVLSLLRRVQSGTRSGDELTDAQRAAREAVQKRNTASPRPRTVGPDEASDLPRQSRAPSPAQGEMMGEAVPARSGPASRTAASGTRGGTINTPRAAQARSAFGEFSDATRQSVPESVMELINRARTGGPPARVPDEDEMLELLNRVQSAPPSRRGVPVSSGRVQP